MTKRTLKRHSHQENREKNVIEERGSTKNIQQPQEIAPDNHGPRGQFKPLRKSRRILRTLRRSLLLPGSTIVITISVYSGISKNP